MVKPMKIRSATIKDLFKDLFAGKQKRSKTSGAMKASYAKRLSSFANTSKDSGSLSRYAEIPSYLRQKLSKNDEKGANLRDAFNDTMRDIVNATDTPKTVEACCDTFLQARLHSLGFDANHIARYMHYYATDESCAKHLIEVIYDNSDASPSFAKLNAHHAHLSITGDQFMSDAEKDAFEASAAARRNDHEKSQPIYQRLASIKKSLEAQRKDSDEVQTLMTKFEKAYVGSVDYVQRNKHFNQQLQTLYKDVALDDINIRLDQLATEFSLRDNWATKLSASSGTSSLGSESNRIDIDNTIAEIKHDLQANSGNIDAIREQIDLYMGDQSSTPRGVALLGLAVLRSMALRLLISWKSWIKFRHVISTLKHNRMHH